MSSCFGIGLLLSLFRRYCPNRFLRLVFWNIFACTVILVHAEAIVRLKYTDLVVDNIYTLADGLYTHRPNLSKSIVTNEYDCVFTTNSQGYRVANNTDSTTLFASTDWMVFGDSFTQGAQVDYRELFTTRLFSYFPSKVILNVGVSGYGIADELELATRLLPQHSPDLIILQLSPFNDFYHVRRSRIGLLDRLCYYSMAFRLLLQNRLYRDPTSLPLGRWSEPFFPTYKENADYNVFFRPGSDTKAADLDAVDRYLRDWSDLAFANDARLIVILIPTKEQVRLRELLEVIDTYDIDLQDLDMRAPNQLLATCAERNGFLLIDLYEDFAYSEDFPFYELDEHLNAHGHELVARGIHERLITEGFGVKPRLVAAEHLDARYPQLNGDGSELVFQAMGESSFELFIADTNLSYVRQLTCDSVDQIHPTFRPLNHSIAFTEGVQEQLATEVVLLDLSTGSRRILTPEPDVYGSIPCFSSCGDTAFYAFWIRGSDGTVSPSHIALHDLTSNKRETITSGEHEHWRPTYNRREECVSYIANRDGDYDIFSYYPATGATICLYRSDVDEWDPQWSRRGETLLFSSHTNGNWDLYSLGRDGYCRRLTDTKGDEWDPFLAPNECELWYAGRYGSNSGIQKLSLTQYDSMAD